MIRRLFSLNRPLIPGFLRKLDERWMADKPLWWSLRLHLIAWYVLLTLAIAGLYLFLKPDNPRIDTTVYVPISVMVILSIIAVVVWMIFLLRFNVFKRFGTYKAHHALFSLGAYILSALGLLSFPFLPGYIEDYRATSQFSPKEVVEDVNTMNALIAHMVYDSLQVDWSRDTVWVNDSLAARGCYHEEESYPNQQKWQGCEFYTDSAEIGKVVDHRYWGHRILAGDSFQVIAPSRIVFLTEPTYTNISVYGAWEGASGMTFTSERELYFKIHREHPSVNLKEASDRYAQLYQKYRDPDYSNSEYQGWDYESVPKMANGIDSEDNYLTRFYASHVESGINNIGEREFLYSPDNASWIFRLWLYPSLFLGLAVWIFRHSTVRSFFLTLLVGFVVSVLTGITSALMNLEFSGVMIFGLMIWCGFMTLMWIANRGIRDKIRGISLNLVTITVYFLPLIVNAIYWDQQRHWMYRSDMDSSVYSECMARSMARAEWVGLLVLGVFVYAIAYRFYRNWYAAPEE